ncbi:MAG: response regulator [Planctomycetota bacterium]|nr:response regulator [Planctomycetota bacterium]
MRTSTLSRVSERLQDAFVAADYDEQTRRSMAISVGLRLLALGPPFILLYAYLKLPTAAWVLTIAELLNLTALVQLGRRKSSYTWGWVIVLGLMGAIFGTLYVGGGLRSPASAWLLLSPLLGCYLFGLRGATITVLLTVAGLAGYAVWEYSVGVIPHMVPESLQNPWNFLIVATAVLATLAITNSWMAMLGRERQRQGDAERALGNAIGSLTEAVSIYETEAGKRSVRARNENPASKALRKSLEESGHGLAALLGVEVLDVETLTGLSYVSTENALRVKHPVTGAFFDARVTTSQDGFVLCLSDVSMHVAIEEQLRRATHEALEASRLKSEFLATMSHEIRTPMNGILGMTELALQGELLSEQRDCLLTVHDCAENLLHLINDILDLSKIEAGRIELEVVPFDLIDVLEGVQDGLSPKAAEKGLEWNAFARPSVNTRLVGDPLRLRQVLLNLASNAIKFTESGQVTLEVSALEGGAEGATRLRFEMRDTGIGVSEEARARLFQKFVQADSSTTRRYGGTGLGLAISRQLVQLMGGELEVESSPGKGSCFFFEAVFMRDTAAATQPEVADVLVGRRVLVVDDVEVNRRVLAGQARRLGCRYEVAESAEQALAKVSEAAESGDPFFCVWTDQCMPGKSGLELGRMIRADHRNDATRLMLLSSYHDFHDSSEARAAGFQSWNSKPIRLALLRQEMSRLVSAPAPQGAEEPSASVPPTVVKAATEARPQARERLLLAEDNPVNRKLALKMLERAGFLADVATNGAEAIDKVKQNTYDLVLMDCQMPEMDGYEATRKIRALGGVASQLPIVALTANAMVGDREKCMAAGMSDYLSKPLRQDEFHAMLERWLGRAVSVK